MIELSLHDVQIISAALLKYRGLDMSHYLDYPLKRSYEKAMEVTGIHDADEVRHRLKHDKNYAEEFLSLIAFGSSEMFRDASFWTYLRDYIMPSLVHQVKEKVRVWFPYVASGDELYSFLIMVHEMGWNNQVETEASVPLKSMIQKVKENAFPQHKLKISMDNYHQYQGRYSLAIYLQQKEGKTFRNPTLIEKVKFSVHPFPLIEPERQYHLILFRNKMIYLNQTMQDRIVSIIHKALYPAGLLAVGVKENMGSYSLLFKPLYREENIFIKI